MPYSQLVTKLDPSRIKWLRRNTTSKVPRGRAWLFSQNSHFLAKTESATKSQNMINHKLYIFLL